MGTGRLEAFSDGVIAIIITIMVLELKVPHGDQLHELKPLLPVFLSYLLSFVYVGIYWNNHHHLFQASERVSGTVLWCNLHLLFWMSLIPFVTGWMGENHFATVPTALYGVVLLMSAVSFAVLQTALLATQKENGPLAKAIGKDWKGKVSIACYAVAIALAFVNQWIADGIYVAVALLWFVPDKRVERELKRAATEAGLRE